MTEKPWLVLIIDDNPEDRRDMRRMLLLGSDRKYAFTEVSLGQQGISAIRALSPEHFDCVLLDFRSRIWMLWNGWGI